MSIRRWRPVESRVPALGATAADLSTSWRPKTWSPALPRYPLAILRITTARPHHPAQQLQWLGSCCSTVSRPPQIRRCPWREKTLPVASQYSQHSSWTTWLASRAFRWDVKMKMCFYIFYFFLYVTTTAHQLIWWQTICLFSCKFVSLSCRCERAVWLCSGVIHFAWLVWRLIWTLSRTKVSGSHLTVVSVN